MNRCKPELAEALLRAGADPNLMEGDTRRTICHDVAESGYLDTLRCLLKHGADLSRRDRWGDTPAHCGAKRRQLSVVQYLSCGFPIGAVNGQGRTVLDILADFDDCSAFRSWVAEKRGSPQSLQCLAVIATRENLGPSRLKYVDSDPIPQVIKDLVLLQKVVDANI